MSAPHKHTTPLSPPHISIPQKNSWIDGDYKFPLLPERVRKVREVGNILHEHFDGLAANVVKQAKHSAQELVRLITAYFPGFRDEAVYHGTQV